MPQNGKPAWEKEHWSESSNPDRIAWGIGRWFLVGFLAVVVISLLWWGGSVLFSGVKGKGDVIKQNNNANNQVAAQAYFQKLNGDIQSYGTQLGTAGEEMTAHPGDSYFETNYAGLLNTCISAVNEYNAAAGQTLFKDWRSANLPESIDANSACPKTPIPATSK